MSLPEVRWYIGFTSPTVSDVFTVGHPTLGRVGMVPIGADDVWTDVTAYVRSWSIKRGAGRGDDPTLRYDPATATIELNDGDRRFDPENLDGPYVSAGRSQIEPMRRVKGVITWNGVTYPLFYGLADDFEPQYQGNSWTYTVLTATDPSKVFAALNRLALGSPVGAGEDSGARVNRILDAAGWPSSARVISTGDTTLQSTDLAGNALGELQLVQDSEGGEFYFDAQGRAVFRNRKAILTATRSTTVQAVFGDGGYTPTAGAYLDVYSDTYLSGGGEIPYADAKPSTGDDALANSVTAAIAGGTEQHAEDLVSVNRYLEKTHTRDDLLMQTDAEALNWAEAIVYQYSEPARRFARLEFSRPRPDVQDAAWPAILGREFGDRVKVVRRPAGGGVAIVRDCFVRGLEYSSDGATFDTAFILQGADRFSFFVVGDPIYGRVGYNAVAY